MPKCVAALDGDLLRRHGVVAGPVAHLQLGGIGIVLGGGVDLDIDAAKVRIGESRAGVVGDQILRAQFVANLPECGIQLLQSTGVKVLASGVARKLNERVFTADVSPCATFNRHDDDAVENDLGLLGSANGIVIVGLADGVAAIGDYHHDLAAAALQQRSRAQVKSVVEGRRSPGPNVVDGAVDHSNIGSKRRYLVNDYAELKQGQAIDGTQDGVREAARGFQFELLITPSAEASVDGDDDGKR